MNNLIKNITDPYTLIAIKLLISDERAANLAQEFADIDTLELNAVQSVDCNEVYEILSQGIFFPIDATNQILFARKTHTEKFLSILSELSIPYKVEDGFSILWNMTDVQQFVKHEAYSKLLEIIESHYNIDDVLDVISQHGISSLSDIHKHILQK